MAAGGRDRAPPACVRRALVLYVAWMAVLILLHAVWPPAENVTFVLMPLSSALAVAAGAIVYQPTARGPWLLLSVGIGVWAAEDLYLTVIGQAESSSTAPLPVQLLSSAGYILSLLALLLLVNRRVVDDRGGILDGLMLVTALALLGWAFLVVPYIGGNASGMWRDRSAMLAFPLAAAIRIPLLARLFIGGGTRSPAAWLLVAGAVTGFVSDVAYAGYWLSGRHLSQQFGLGIGWAVFYVAWGAAGLHPSMAEVGEPVPHRIAVAPWSRLAFLGGVCLIAPLALLSWAAAHREGELITAGSFASVAIALVLTRLGLLFAQYRRAGDRERVVSAAGVAMVSAVSVSDIVDTVDRAGEALLADSGRLTLAWLDSAPPDRSGLVTTADLPEALAEIAAGHPAALVFPLVASTARTRRLSAALIAAGTARELVPLHESVETLAGQAALAIDRVELVDEVRRRANEEYFRTLIQNAADGIMIVADDGWIRYASPSADRLFAPARPSGRRLRDLVGDEPVDQVEAVLRGRGTGPVHWALRRPDGERFEAEVTAADLRADETVRAIVLTVRDVTEQRELQAQLTRQALHDPLTDLPNRRRFQQHLDTSFPLASPADPLYLILLDLDDFKEINDTRGHGVGDQLLVAVGRRLSAAVRPSDVAARIGGDEFAVLLEHVPAPGAAEALAERIVRAFDSPFTTLDGEPISVGISAGLASSEQAETAEELLRNADLAQYLAKKGGKHDWARFQPGLHDDLLERAGMRASLDQAIAGHQIRMHYQPIVELGDGRVVGFEALVRLPDPKHGLLPPNRFIPLAEETGQIIPLGRRILRQAAEEAVLWNTLATRDGVWVGVNLSGRQFADPGFVDGVARTLDECGLPPPLLVFELTETSLLQDGDGQVPQVLAALKELGVRIALDDFGTGFSSLSYLTELPVDILKIDKSFIAGVTGSRVRAALVDGIIQIADALGMAVIAEGIETPEQRRRLAATHCEYGQGYLFGRPMAGDAVRELLRADSEPHLPRAAPGPAAARRR